MNDNLTPPAAADRKPEHSTESTNGALDGLAVGSTGSTEPAAEVRFYDYEPDNPTSASFLSCRVVFRDRAAILAGHKDGDTMPLYTHSATSREAPADLTALREALESIAQYGSDTLSGRVDGPVDYAWLRTGVAEMARRARAALASSPSPEPKP